MAFLEVYFDESGSHDGSPVFCMAGYLFEKEACRKLDLAWKEVLDRFGLPYFHMVDCAPGNPPFDKLGPDGCIAVEKEVIALIRSHALFGTAFAIAESDYNELFPDGQPLGDAYTYCCWTCLSAIHGWIIEHQFDGKIGYFFEAGHASQPKANAIMNQIFKNRDLRREHRYAAHGFVQKECSRPVQSADLLAWLHATHVKNLLKPIKKQRPPRKDYLALIEDRAVRTTFAAREHLLVMRRQIDSLFAGRPLITGVYGSSPFVAN